jgi:hypothetical protein
MADNLARLQPPREQGIPETCPAELDQRRPRLAFGVPPREGAFEGAASHWLRREGVDELAEAVEELPDAARLRVRRNRVLEVKHDALQRGGVGERKGRLRRWGRRLLEDPLGAGDAFGARTVQPVDRVAPAVKQASMMAEMQATREAEALDGHRP